MPDADQPSESPPSILSPWVTAVCGLFVVVYVGLAGIPSSSSRLDQLDHPEESLERLVSRDLDLLGALPRVADWKRVLYLAFAAPGDTLGDAIAWYDELVGADPAPVTQLYRVILLGEDSQLNRVGAALVPWEFQGELAARMARWVRAAYLTPVLDRETGRSLVVEIHSELAPGWFADVLVARVAAAMGDRAVQAETEAAIVARGEALLDRWISLILGQLVLLAFGAVVLARVLAKRLPLVVGDAHLPPLWSQQDGLGLFVRGVFGFLLIGLAFSLLLPKESVFTGIMSLVAGMPMVWWTLRYCSLRGLSLPLAFGLKLQPGRVARIVGATLVISTLSVLGEVLINIGSDALHIKAHWAEGLLENLLWGPLWLVACEVLDSIVWAPLIEELAFRGVLYATLRMAIGVWPAIGASAAFFALVHGYGVIGFASVFWSGLLWALAYERTRSLLPAILAHAINNLFVSVEFFWLLRV
jgi:membrane protease YdiL (CAAX protease family)